MLCQNEMEAYRFCEHVKRSNNNNKRYSKIVTKIKHVKNDTKRDAC